MSKVPPKMMMTVYRKDLPTFARKSFSILNHGDLWLDNWHIEAICYQLQRVISGRCRRLIINLPPRCLKSHLSSIALPAFMLGQNPSQKIACVSYSQNLSEKHSSDCRRLVESPWYRAVFPSVRLVRSTAAEIETSQGGYRLATSTEGTLTGRGGNPVIIDDPLNAIDGNSSAARDSANKWYSTTLLSRLNDPSMGAIIVIMQRLHEDDLVGHIMKLEQWDVLNLPAIAPADMRVALSDSRNYFWRQGELLHPARLSHAVLQNRKRSMGTDVFNAQYLMAPVPETGNMIRRHWLKYYDPPLVREHGDMIVQTWDTAMKTGPANDYSVCLTFYVRNKNEYYLIDVFRKRLEFQDLLKEVAPLAAKFGADTVLIEEIGSGIPFAQMARNLGVQGVQGIPDRRDKITRVRSAIPKIEGGSLFLPKSAPWLDDLLSECLGFPNVKHDDQVDALSQFLNWRTNSDSSFFEADFGWGDDSGAPDPDSLLWRRRG
jgi:predicted phage terminase large subunit-like protein